MATPLFPVRREPSSKELIGAFLLIIGGALDGLKALPSQILSLGTGSPELALDTAKPFISCGF